MPLPADVSPTRVIRALERDGWTLDRHAGGHAIMTRPGRRPISVPMHKVVKRGLLRAIIKQAGLTVDRFAELLERR